MGLLKVFSRTRAGMPVREEAAPVSQGPFYLIAEPGWPNYGDELIAREWLRYLAAAHPDVPVILDCNRPGSAASILRGEHPHLTCVDTLARLTFERDFRYAFGSEDSIFDIAAAVRRSLEWRGGNPRYAMGVKLIESARSFHYVGGGYMSGKHRCNLARLELGKWAAERGVPVIATGLGLVPFEGEGLEYVQGALSEFKFVGLRDASSYEGVKSSCNAALMPDDCFVNGLASCVSDASDMPSTMICIQSEFDLQGGNLFSLVESQLNAWDIVPGGETVGVVECNPVFDRDIYDWLFNKGYDLKFYPTLDVLLDGLPVRSGQRWISTRYHPHLVASAYGCKGSFISVSDDYYGAKHEAVRRMGSGWSEIASAEDAGPLGQGFSNPETRFVFRDSIRGAASVIYG